MARHFFIYISILLLCSCSSVDIHTEAEDFYADVKTSLGSRAFLGDENDRGMYPVLWEAGDRIKIFDKDGDGSVYITDDDQVTSARFHYDRTLGKSNQLKTSTAYYAGYPSSLWTGIGQLTFPSGQRFRSHNIGSGAMPMLSIREGRQLSFSGICGILRLSVTGKKDLKVSRVRICSNRDIGGITGSDPTLSGNIEWKSEKRESMTAGRPLELDCSGNEPEIPEDFHIVIPALTFDRMAFQIYCTDGSVLTYFLPGRVSIRRNTLTCYTIPSEAFSDVIPILNEGDSLVPLTSLEYILEAQDFDADSDTTVITSIRRESFTDGTEYTHPVECDIVFSTDGGASFFTDAPEVLRLKQTDDGYLIIHDILSTDCIVEFKQRVSGKSLRITLSG